MDKIRIYIALLFCQALSFIHPVQAQDINGSSIVSRTILQSGGTKCLEQHIYDNGLGDVMREVQSYSGTSFPDIIINHEYDQYRRKTKTWKPVTSRYNISQTVATNHLGRVDITSTKYSYTGKPTNISINHNLRASGEKEYYTYTYDGADRLSKVTHKLDNGSEISLQQNSYNGLGQLTGTSNSVFATSYAYEIHSWLKRIYSWNRSTLFEENLKYADSDNPCYNGNISAMTWQNNGSTTQRYDYIYDNASRLVSSSYTSGSNSNRYNTQYSYDCMGNITSLSRNGLLDDGSYGLILPSAIEFAGGKTIKYTYSADGHKLRAVYTTVTPSTTKQIDYCGNLIFENGQLQQINVDGGYATYIGSLWAYHYYVKDHLGNNRMVIHPSSLHQQPQVNNYYPYGGLMANSTNHNQQRYKYNGKELDRMHGLDWYDYGARWMDAAIGRWHRIDPLCEKYYDVSPYIYCHNNPIMLFDFDGKDDFFDAFGKFLFNKGNGGAIYIQQGKQYIAMQKFDLRKHSNMQMAANVVGYYADAVGIKYNMNGGKGMVGVSTLHSTDNENGRVLAGTKDGNIYIKMKNGHFDDYMYDSYQLKSTLVHENEHKEQRGKKNDALIHAEIVLTEMQNPNYKYCSEDYKDDQRYMFFLYLRTAREETEDKDKQEKILELKDFFNKITSK